VTCNTGFLVLRTVFKKGGPFFVIILAILHHSSHRVDKFKNSVTRHAVTPGGAEFRPPPK